MFYLEKTWTLQYRTIERSKTSSENRTRVPPLNSGLVGSASPDFPPLGRFTPEKSSGIRTPPPVLIQTSFKLEIYIKNSTCSHSSPELRPEIINQSWSTVPKELKGVERNELREKIFCDVVPTSHVSMGDNVRWSNSWLFQFLFLISSQTDFILVRFLLEQISSQTDYILDGLHLRQILS